jgi:hypothetical protein
MTRTNPIVYIQERIEGLTREERMTLDTILDGNGLVMVLHGEELDTYLSLTDLGCGLNHGSVDGLMQTCAMSAVDALCTEDTRGEHRLSMRTLTSFITILVSMVYGPAPVQRVYDLTLEDESLMKRVRYAHLFVLTVTHDLYCYLLGSLGFITMFREAANLRDPYFFYDAETVMFIKYELKNNVVLENVAYLLFVIAEIVATQDRAIVQSLCCAFMFPLFTLQVKQIKDTIVELRDGDTDAVDMAFAHADTKLMATCINTIFAFPSFDYIGIGDCFIELSEQFRKELNGCGYQLFPQEKRERTKIYLRQRRLEDYVECEYWECDVEVDWNKRKESSVEQKHDERALAAAANAEADMMFAPSDNSRSRRALKRKPLPIADPVPEHDETLHPYSYAESTPVRITQRGYTLNANMNSGTITMYVMKIAGVLGMNEGGVRELNEELQPNDVNLYYCLDFEVVPFIWTDSAFTVALYVLSIIIIHGTCQYEEKKNVLTCFMNGTLRCELIEHLFKAWSETYEQGQYLSNPIHKIQTCHIEPPFRTEGDVQVRVYNYTLNLVTVTSRFIFQRYFMYVFSCYRHGMKMSFILDDTARTNFIEALVLYVAREGFSAVRTRVLAMEECREIKVHQDLSVVQVTDEERKVIEGAMSLFS